jgi:hypothetical protein
MQVLKPFTTNDPAMRDTPEADEVIDNFVNSSRIELGDNLAGRYWTRIHKRCDGDVIAMAVMVKRERWRTRGALWPWKPSSVTVEDDHAKHRQAAQVGDQVVSATRLSATSTNRQAAEHGAQTVTQEVRLMPIKNANPKQNMTLEEKIMAYRRMPSAAMQHRSDWVASQRSLDASFDCVTDTAWLDWHKAWGILDDETRARYVEQHQLGRSIKALVPLTDGASSTTASDVAIVAANVVLASTRRLRLTRRPNTNETWK